MNKIMRGVALGAALTVGLAACSSGGGTAAAVAIAITANDFSFDAPAEVTGGLVTITLTDAGSEDHEVQLAKLGEGKGVGELVQALQESGEGGPTPEWITTAGGVQPIKAGESASVTTNLAAGSYALLCFVSGDDGVPHFAKGMVKPLTVAGGTAGALPSTDGTITAREYSFDAPALTAGTHTFTFSNAGPKQPHLVSFAEFPEGTTKAEVEAAFAAFAADPESDPDIPEPEGVGGYSAIEPGMSGTFDVTLTAGRVVILMCFISDREGGPPHFIKGMASILEVA